MPAFMSGALLGLLVGTAHIQRQEILIPGLIKGFLYIFGLFLCLFSMLILIPNNACYSGSKPINE